MEVLESVTVTALDQLGNLYARPSERVLRKEIDHVDAAGRAFIAASHRRRSNLRLIVTVAKSFTAATLSGEIVNGAREPLSGQPHARRRRPRR